MKGSDRQEVSTWFWIQDENSMGDVASHPSQWVFPAVATTLISWSPSDWNHFCALLFISENKAPPE